MEKRVITLNLVCATTNAGVHMTLITNLVFTTLGDTPSFVTGLSALWLSSYSRLLMEVPENG